MAGTILRQTATLKVPRYGTFEIGEYGAPDGEPYFFIPGFLGSLHQAILLDSDAKKLNMRIIGINKPGVGLSAFRDVRNAKHFGVMVMHIADALHIDRFGLIGLSLGSHLVLGCAAAAGNRVTATSIAGMLPPMDMALYAEDMNGWRHHILRHHNRYRSVLRSFFRILSALTHTFPELMIPVLLVYYARFSPSILGTLRGKKMLSQDIRDVFLCDGCVKGLMQDVRLASDWGFNPRSIKTPVLVLHGEQDTLAPIEPARHIAKLLPDATCMFIPGDHVSVVHSASRALYTLKNLSHGKKVPVGDVDLQTEQSARPILALLPRWKMF